MRGATGTTPLSSTGPCAGSTGGGGSVKSRGDCCAAAGVAIRMTADRIRAEFARIAPFIPAQDGAALNGSGLPIDLRSEEHTSELQSLMRISYAVFCLQKNKQDTHS